MNDIQTVPFRFRFQSFFALTSDLEREVQIAKQPRWMITNIEIRQVEPKDEFVFELMVKSAKSQFDDLGDAFLMSSVKSCHSALYRRSSYVRRAL